MNAETRRRMYQVLGVILFEKDTVTQKRYSMFTEQKCLKWIDR